MRGSRLRGERGQAPGQRGPRRGISRSRSNSEGGEGSTDPGRPRRGLAHAAAVPTLAATSKRELPGGHSTRGPRRIRPSGAQPQPEEWSVGCAGWGGWGGCLCASLALSESKDTPTGWERQRGCEREGDRAQRRPGWERRDKTCAARQHRPCRYCMAAGGDGPRTPVPERLRQPGALPCSTRAPAKPPPGLPTPLGGCCPARRMLPRRPPQPAPPALPPRCQGASSHSALAMAARSRRPRALASQTGREERASSAFPSRGRPRERKRPGTGCLSQRPSPLSRPRPLFLPRHRPGAGMAEGPPLCTAQPPSTRPAGGPPRGPAKVVAEGLVPLSVRPCGHAQRGDGVLGAMARTGWAPPG